jgi:hypothetical protein
MLNNATETTMDIAWTLPASSNILVVMRKNVAVSDLPVSGIEYTPSALFGEGDQFADGSFVVYAGNGSGFRD